MGDVNQKDILRNRLKGQGVNILVQEPVYPPKELPTGDLEGERQKFQGESGTVYDPLTGEDNNVALEFLNGKVIAESAHADRIFFNSYKVTEHFVDDQGVDIENSVVTVLKEAAPIQYKGSHKIISEYSYLGYMIGEDLIEGDPTGMELHGDVVITYVYAPMVPIESAVFKTLVTDTAVLVTLIGGKFKEGEIKATDFTFQGDNSEAFSEGVFQRLSDNVVSITELTLVDYEENVIVVDEGTMEVQAEEVEVTVVVPIEG